MDHLLASTRCFQKPNMKIENKFYQASFILKKYLKLVLKLALLTLHAKIMDLKYENKVRHHQHRPWYQQMKGV